MKDYLRNAYDLLLSLFSRETGTRKALQNAGKLGEDIIVKHLVKQKYNIIERNYAKKWGEIDVIAKKDGILHFFEVKAVKQPSTHDSFSYRFRPEDRVHFWKRRRIARAIQSYCAEHNVSYETEWQVNVAAVFLDFKRRRARIRMTEDIDISV